MPKKYPIVVSVISIFIFLALIIAGLLSSPSYRERMAKTFPFLPFLGTPPKPPAPPAYVAPQRTLTPDEQKVLNIPLHNTSAEEKQQHAAGVAKLAETTQALDVTGCKPDPLVYKVNLKGSFQVKNDDAISHSIRYVTVQIMIPARGTTTIQTSQLFKKAGDYGYGCDNPFAKMGVFMVR